MDCLNIYYSLLQNGACQEYLNWHRRRGYWCQGCSLFTLPIFASHHETYGSLGGIIILLMWFYLSTFIILLGAELNAALELQTMRDTTVGVEREMGERGAYVTDHVERK